jgi:dolichol-phosphate mannosyltransferase
VGDRSLSLAPARQRLTIVAPVYNEVEGIAHFTAAVLEVLDRLPYDATLILVDDGATDGTAEVLDRLHAAHPERVTVIHLSRNFGHQAALTAGMDHADGDAMICLDCDMQHPPTLIPALIERWQAGYDIVQAARREVGDVGLFKRFTTGNFYRVLNLLSATHIEPMASDFRLLSRPVLEVFQRDLRERDRFIRGLVSWVGFRYCRIEFDPPPRFAGHTNYSLGKMLRFARSGLISFSKLPLKVASILGLVVSGFSLLYGLFAIFAWVFMSRSVMQGWASIILVTTFLGGCQLLFLGLIGEYIATMFDEIKARPVYIVARQLSATSVSDERSMSDER